MIRHEQEDTLVWVPDVKGEFLVSSAFAEIREKGEMWNGVAVYGIDIFIQDYRALHRKFFIIV